jgi:CheY-like chemotaxis protein
MASIIPAITLPVSVLVVEDEPLVRILAVETLTCAGYTVYASPSAHHAVDFLFEKSIGVDVLFTASTCQAL